MPRLRDVFFTLQDGDDFESIPSGEGNKVLAGKPNHIIIGPSLFISCDGAKSFKAKDLAKAIIKDVDRRMDEADDQEQDFIEEEKEKLGHLLAFLWAAARGNLKTVTLDDPPESPQLNHLCERVRLKLKGPPPPGGGEAVVGGVGDTQNLAVATQAMVLVLQANENNRKREREEDQQNKSLIRNLGPKQQSLFTRLATKSLRDPPRMTAFMKSVLSEKSPHKATNLILAETRKWKGTFSLAGLYRFFSSGFLSQSSNSSDPGGFTGFMFYPRSLGPTPINKDKQRIREFFDLDVDEDTIDHYLKMEYFVPKNENELRIQLETWRDTLAMVTCVDTVANDGLSHFLERFDDLYSTIQEMFQVVPNFGLLVLLTLDRHLQKFYEMVSEMRVVTNASSYERRYLHNKCDELIEALEGNVPPSIIIPKCLLSPAPSGGKKAKEAKGTEGTTKTQEKEKGKEPPPVEKVKNSEVEKAWGIPEGQTYIELFPRSSPNLLGWPKFADPRHHPAERPLCVRFHSTGICRKKCTLAHTLKSKMSAKEEVAVSSRFREVYHP